MDSDFSRKATDRRSVSSGVMTCAGACEYLSPGRRNALTFLVRTPVFARRPSCCMSGVYCSLNPEVRCTTENGEG